MYKNSNDWLSKRLRRFENAVLRRLLKRAGGVTKAAALAGRNRTQFFRLLDRNGLMPKKLPTPKGSECSAGCRMARQFGQRCGNRCADHDDCGNVKI